MSEKKFSPVTTALSAAFLASVTLNASASVGNANPFAAEDLSSGYNLAMQEGEDKKKEGRCGTDKKKEGKCGEGKCGESKKKEDKKKEGKCGEGKCGG